MEIETILWSKHVVIGRFYIVYCEISPFDVKRAPQSRH
jgi:hypothetical protein